MLGRRTTLKHPRFRTAIAKIDHDIRLGIEADEYLSSTKYLWKNYLAPLLPNASSYLPFLNPPPDNADLSTRLLGKLHQLLHMAHKSIKTSKLPPVVNTFQDGWWTTKNHLFRIAWLWSASLLSMLLLPLGLLL